jgi:hypothetical protein
MGQWQVFVMMINDPRAEQAETATVTAVNLVQRGTDRPVLATLKRN